MVLRLCLVVIFKITKLYKVTKFLIKTWMKMIHGHHLTLSLKKIMLIIIKYHLNLSLVLNLTAPQKKRLQMCKQISKQYSRLYHKSLQLNYKYKNLKWFRLSHKLSSQLKLVWLNLLEKLSIRLTKLMHLLKLKF